MAENVERDRIRLSDKTSPYAVIVAALKSAPLEIQLRLLWKVTFLCAWDALVDRFVTRCPGTLIIDLRNGDARITHEESGIDGDSDLVRGHVVEFHWGSADDKSAALGPR